MRNARTILAVCILAGCTTSQWSPPNAPNNAPALVQPSAVRTNSVIKAPLPPLPGLGTNLHYALPPVPYVILGPPKPITVHLGWTCPAVPSLGFIRTNSLQRATNVAGPWVDVLVWRSDQQVENYQAQFGSDRNLLFRTKSTPLSAWTPY